MRSGKDAYDAVVALAGFVGNTYTIHVSVLAAILGGLVTASVGSVPIGWEIRAVLTGLYLFVGLSSLVFLFDLYARINAANLIARRLMLQDLGAVEGSEEAAAVEAMTRPVRGYVYRLMFPIIVLIFTAMIWLLPSAPSASG
ncbi:MAG: hypothetical protein AAGC57_13285 [Pseudomonadota bacterium]